MPTFISHVTIDFDKLLQYSTVAASALCSEPCRIVEVAENVAFMFIVRILRAKESGADRTCEVVHMEFLV